MTKRLRGFTLIELLAVIAIIALLAGAILLALGPVRGKARDARRKTDLNQLQTALEAFNDDNGFYPKASGSLTSDRSNPNWISGLAPKYLKVVPSDPKEVGTGTVMSSADTYRYTYQSDATGGKYMIVARLENPDDKERCGLAKYITVTGGSLCGPSGHQTQLYLVGSN